MLNAVAAGLLALAWLKHDRGGAKLNLETQYDTCQMPSAAQPEACYPCDGLERRNQASKAGSR